MDFKLSLSLIIPGLVTVFGWYALNRLSANRDKANKKKDMKVKYLIEAWRKLENASNRKNYNPNELESAIADIHLFGNLKQIKLAKDFANEFASNKKANIDKLLEELRNDLRTELNLEKIDDNINHLRIII